MLAAWPLLEDVSDMVRRGGAPRGPRRWASQEQFLEAVLPVIKTLRAAEGKATADASPSCWTTAIPGRCARRGRRGRARRRHPRAAAPARRPQAVRETWEEFRDTHD